jgi:hypothetical protein
LRKKNYRPFRRSGYLESDRLTFQKAPDLYIGVTHNIDFMLKNSIDLEKRHQRFIKEVVKSSEVWTLKNESGHVSSSSNHYNDENEEPLLVQVFWSTSKEAEVCSRHAWNQENFELDSIPIAEFIEFWCVGMHNDYVIVGTNFDHQLFGYEEEPLILAQDLLNELKSNNINITFENYTSVDDLLNTIKEHTVE